MQVLLSPEYIDLQLIKVIDQSNKLEAEIKTNKNLDLPTLPNQMKESKWRNTLFAEVCKYLANFENWNRLRVYLCGSKVSNGLLHKNNKL